MMILRPVSGYEKLYKNPGNVLFFNLKRKPKEVDRESLTEEKSKKRLKEPLKHKF